MRRFKIKLLTGALSCTLGAFGATFAPAILAAHADPAFYEASPETVLGAPGTIVHIESMHGGYAARRKPATLGTVGYVIGISARLPLLGPRPG